MRALRNAVATNSWGHAYLFSGPRGTGKTSTARILAKALNCTALVDGEPCGQCASCVAIAEGTSFDVHELDAASNNGVDAIRDLIERAALGTPGRTKVYILDEVHMLSKAAEAALLKTLEEPPPHVVFVLATTDPQKVSATIRSRCQPFEFHLLPAGDLERHVRFVISDAGLEVTDDAVEAILRQGGGSARDTLSALDQVAAAGGTVSASVSVEEFVEAFIERDTGRALVAMAHAAETGRDPRTLAENIVVWLREMFLSMQAPELLRLSESAAERATDQGRRYGAASTVKAMEVLGELLIELRHAPDPRLMLEVGLIRLTNPALDVSPAALLERIERLERSGPPAPSGHDATGEITRPAAARPSAPAATSATAPAPAASGPAAARAVLGSMRGAPSPGAAQPPARPAGEPEAARPAPRTPTADRPPSASAVSPGTGSPGTEPGPSPDPAPSSSHPGPAAPTNPAPAAPPSPITASSPGGLPPIEMLEAAWNESVVSKIKPIVRAMYKAGRFVGERNGKVQYAFDTSVQRDKCEEHRVDVEAALAAHFGRAVPLELVLRTVDQRAAASSGSVEEMIDPTELVDAPPATARSGLDRLTEAFPGAELVREDRPR